MFGCPERIAGRLLCDARLQRKLASLPWPSSRSNRCCSSHPNFSSSSGSKVVSGDDGHRHQTAAFPPTIAPGGSVGSGSNRQPIEAARRSPAFAQNILVGLHGPPEGARRLAGSAYQQQIELLRGQARWQRRRSGASAASIGVAPILSDTAQKKHTQIVLGDGVTRPWQAAERSPAPSGTGPKPHRHHGQRTTWTSAETARRQRRT